MVLAIDTMFLQSYHINLYNIPCNMIEKNVFTAQSIASIIFSRIYLKCLHLQSDMNIASLCDVIFLIGASLYMGQHPAYVR